jgi:molecular chaperone GrpE
MEPAKRFHIEEAMMAEAEIDQSQQQPQPPEQQSQAQAAERRDDNELLSLLQRERADFANYRRRAALERVEEGERARAQQLLALLPVLDDLDRAFSQVPDDLRDHPWTRGIALSHNKLLEFLSRAGVEQIGVLGEPFDPANHEAIFYEEKPNIADRQVTSVIQPGYRLGTRVLRPAQVGVIGPAGSAGNDGSPANTARDA